MGRRLQHDGAHRLMSKKRGPAPERPWWMADSPAHTQLDGYKRWDADVVYWLLVGGVPEESMSASEREHLREYRISQGAGPIAYSSLQDLQQKLKERGDD